MDANYDAHDSKISGGISQSKKRTAQEDSIGCATEAGRPRKWSAMVLSTVVCGQPTEEKSAWALAEGVRYSHLLYAHDVHL